MAVCGESNVGDNAGSEGNAARIADSGEETADDEGFDVLGQVPADLPDDKEPVCGAEDDAVAVQYGWMDGWMDGWVGG
ncbi:hypothetical protein N7489_005057 [Penicillium chrysogenum]|uniref:uncharacterized protein n=1 Tax=Penicillium chrysogenum TaxID=5076 RepID=UPI0024DF23CD|nr:uncharacterized protein N7489_005057 [Penicillium chrysogenum]KAJ5244961.1 hypothetical protein N7489_005057 [Penicillium chrysogenum]